MTEPWSTGWSALALGVAGVVLVLAGVRFTRLVDRLADRLGIGEALAGAVLLGATTSLPGLITTGIAARAGNADLAVSNALGGIAAQTGFLAVADLVYPRANLEHAAASLPNLLQTAILGALIGLVLVACGSPGLTVLGVHPVSLLLPVVYLAGLHLTNQSRRDPMWWPEPTAETRRDEPDPEAEAQALGSLLVPFVLLAGAVAGSGWLVARAGLSLVEGSGLSGSFVGGLLTSVVTSLPELVTVIAAVRSGALALAVGDIIGGNTFDVLFLSVGDVFFRGGSIYAAITTPTLLVLGLAVVLTSLLAAGLIFREKRGIGFEGLSILVCYAAGMALLYSVH